MATPGEVVQVQDDEDVMQAALTEIREGRAASAAAEVDAAAAPAAAPAPAPATPAPAPAAAAPAADGKPAAAPAAPATDETDALLAAKRAELHRLTSDIGRVSALNAKALKAEQEAAELRKQLAAVTAPPKSTEEARGRFDDLAEKVKEFPELSELVAVVREAFKEVEGKSKEAATAAAKEVVAPLEPLRQQHITSQSAEQEAANAADLKTFNDTYPDAKAHVASLDFQQWLPKQSADIRRAFYEGKTPGEALPVMDAYDAHLRRSGKPSIARTPQSQQAAAPAASASKPVNDRLARAAGLPSRTGGAPKDSMPAADDFDGSLEYFRNKRLSQQQAAA